MPVNSRNLTSGGGGGPSRGDVRFSTSFEKNTGPYSTNLLRNFILPYRISIISRVSINRRRASAHRSTGWRLHQLLSLFVPLRPTINGAWISRIRNISGINTNRARLRRISRISMNLREENRRLVFLFSSAKSESHEIDEIQKNMQEMCIFPHQGFP